MNGLRTEASPQSRPEGVGVAWRARSASRSLPEGREDAPVSFSGTPPHTHTPRRQSPAFREGGTHPESAPALAERAPLPDPGSAPPSSSADFTDSLSLPHVTVCKGPCSGDGVTCVSRFRLIRSCWTRGKTLQSWVGGSSRGLPRLQVPGGASISRSPQPFTGSQDGAETFANNGKAVCRPASERVCFCLW